MGPVTSPKPLYRLSEQKHNSTLRGQEKEEQGSGEEEGRNSEQGGVTIPGRDIEQEERQGPREWAGELGTCASNQLRSHILHHRSPGSQLQPPDAGTYWQA